MIFILLLSFALFQFTLETTVFGHNEECQVSVPQADQCARKLFYVGDRESYIPHTIKDMDNYCKIMMTNIRCVEMHAKCYKPFSRQVMTMTLHNYKKVTKNICSSGAGRKAFFEHMKCVKDNAQAEVVHRCSDKWARLMEYIEYNVTLDKAFEYVCCSYNLYVDCIEKAVEMECPNANVSKRKEYVRNFSEGTMSELMDLSCGRFRTLQRCETNAKKTFKDLAALQRTEVASSSKSAFFYFLQMTMKFDN